MTRTVLAMHTTGGITAVLIGLMTARGTAQSLATGAPNATFEVASIRPTTRAQVPAPQVLPSGQFEMSGTTLRELIRVAYPTNQGQIDVVGGPGWISTARFDVVAKPRTGARPTLSMLQSLLAQRFKLKVHSETRQGAVWSLTLISRQGALGPDLSPSTCGKMPITSEIKSAEEARTTVMAGPTLCTPLRIGAGPTIVGEASISDLASLLSNFPVINAPVVDRTGLAGAFTIRVRWRADNNPNPEGGPLIFTALEEQLGLKLERGTGQVDVVVIDEVHPLVAD